MSLKSVLVASVLLSVGIGIGYGVSRFTLGGTGPEMSPSGEKKIKYWVAPMDPNFRRDGPGKSAMGMDLIPVYENDDGGNSGGDGEKALKINPSVVNNIGVRTASVTRGTLKREIETVGYLSQNDDLTHDIHVRTEGWIERLDIKTAGERLEKSGRIFQIYSPALVNAQAEYLQALKIKRSGLSKAAHERLIALGISERQIDEIRRSGKVDRLVDFYAPQDGYVVKMNVREGMFIKPRTTVMTIADLKSIWVNVEIYEGQAGWVEKGQKAVMRLPFVPGRIWQGVVDYVYPTVDAKSRTVRTRLKFKNPDEKLKPNMYAEITLFGAPRTDVLSVPREAVIRTGKQERVILALGEGRFRPAKVITGFEAGNRVEIVVGLKADEKVVTSGQFLIDSEASLDASLLRMSVETVRDNEETSMAETVAKGTINSVMVKDRKLNITHGPIAEIGWPTMTMDFAVTDGVKMGGLKPGDKVYFLLKRKAKNLFEISQVSKTKISPPMAMPMAKPAPPGDASVSGARMGETPAGDGS